MLNQKQKKSKHSQTLHNIAEDDPFASLDVNSNQMFTVQPQLKPKHDAMQSGDDVILGMFSSDPAHNTSHNFSVYPCDWCVSIRIVRVHLQCYAVFITVNGDNVSK
eukprot:458800_1